MQSMTNAEGLAKPGRWVPCPTIPTQPVLSLQGFLDRSGQSPPSVLDTGQPVYLTAGRMAILQALRLAEVGPGDAVLMPAFHCGSMVDAVVWLGARPVFYRIRPDLSVDMEDLVSRTGPRARVLLAVNYFGFHQNWDVLRAFCDAHSLILVEDCAHAFFGSRNGQPVGSAGDYTVASLPKWFPVWDGGLLIQRNGAAPPLATRNQTSTQTIQAALSPLNEAIHYGRLPALRRVADVLGAAKAAGRGAMAMMRRSSADNASEINPSRNRSGASGSFDGSWADVGASWPTRAIVALHRTGHIVSARRRNYNCLVNGLEDLPGCRPLFRELPDGTVPFMLPLWIDDLSRIFPLLEDRAVPMQRFGQFLCQEANSSLCSVSTSLSRHLLQLPCHQDLHQREIEWVIAQVREVVTSSLGRRPKPRGVSRALSY